MAGTGPVEASPMLERVKRALETGGRPSGLQETQSRLAVWES